MEPLVQPGIDEIFTSFTARRGVLGAFGHALSYQSQPPMYYMMAAAAWSIEPTFRAIRLVSLLGALACVWSMIPLGRQLGLGRATAPLACACALLPVVQAYAIEARPYSWSMALVVWHVSAMLWLMHARTTQATRFALASVVLTGVAAMLNFYYNGLLVAAVLLAALVLWPNRRQPVVKAGALLTALMLPWVPVIAAQVSVIAENYPIILTTDPLDRTRSVLFAFLVNGVWGAPIFDRPLFAVALVVGFAMLIGRSALHWKGNIGMVGRTSDLGAGDADSASLLLLIASGVGVTLVLLCIRLEGSLMVLPRYLSITVPLLAATTFALVQRESRNEIRRLYWIGVVLMLAIAEVSALRNVDRRDHFRGAASYLDAHTFAGEPILVGTFTKALRFLYHYRGANTVIPLPVDTSSVRYRMRDVLVEHPAAVAARIDSALANAPGFWWVRVPPPMLGIAETDSILRARSTAFDAVADTAIAPLRITHFTRRSRQP